MSTTRTKIWIRIALALLLSLGLAGCKSSSPTETEWRLLLDTAEMGPPVLPALSADEEARVLRGIFGDQYDSFQAAVTAYAEGAFLAPDRRSTLVVAQYPGPTMLGLQDSRIVLAVFDDERVARFGLEPEDGQSLAAVVDVGDGIDRLLLRREQSHMGERTASISVLGLAGGSLERLAHFPLALHDPCDAPLGQDTEIRLARIEMRRAQAALADSAMPADFRAEPYSIPCP
ncbi:MAG: hypothetical protein ACXIUM_12035 [Wenzhouxiangella sp.]